MLLHTLHVLALFAPSDWPTWRGPSQDGVSPETGWTDRGRPLWTRDVGRGYSSVAVVGERVFALGHDVAAETDIVRCLDAATGAELWSFAFAAQLRDQDHTGGSLSSPTVADGKVWVTTREGGLYCLDAATGDELWFTDVATAVETKPGIYGFSASPLLLGDDEVVFCVDRVAALDRNTGELRWASDELDAQFSTPSVFSLAGKERLAVFTQQALCVLDPADGNELMRYGWAPTPRGVNASTPIVVGERVFVSSAYERGAALLAFDADEARAVWQNRRMRNKMAGCVLVNEHLFGFDESMLKCLDLEGNERWRRRGLGNGSLIAAGERLLILSSRGELVVADASPDGWRELSSERIFDDGTFWSPPVLAKGRVYLRSSLGQLACRDHRPLAAPVAADTNEQAADAEAPTSATLFETHLAKIGGAAALKRHDAIRLEGTFEMRSVGFVPTPFVIQGRAPGHWHRAIRLPGGREGWLYRVFDGELGWEENAYLGDTLFSDDLNRELRDSADFHAASDWRALYPEHAAAGRVTFADRPCWRVDATTRSGAKRSLYFDVASGLFVGREGETETITVVDDYRAVDGLLVPMLRTQFVHDTGIEETWRVSSVTFPDELDDALFERPAGVLELLNERAAQDAK